MEQVEVVNEQGEATGIIKPRHEVHQAGDWHRTVDVWLVNSKGEILLQQRSAKKQGNPLKWNSSSAGHVVAGATPLFTARQETREEIGLDLPEEAFEFLFTSLEVFKVDGQTEPAREFAHVYLAEADATIDTLVLQTEEVADVRWVSIVELEQMVVEQHPELVEHPQQYSKLFDHLKERFKNKK